jgi:HTH-type transcriptional regulator/antitoxin HigA
MQALLGKHLIEEGKEAHPKLRAKLDTFCDVVENATWNTPIDLKATLASADPVGPYYAIDVRGKKGARVIILVLFEQHTVSTIDIFTDHDQYKSWTNRLITHLREAAQEGETNVTWKYKHTDEYMKLVRRFPLVPIGSRAQLDQSMLVLNDLMIKKNLSPAESDYVRVLSDLIAAYESAMIKKSAVSAQEALRFLMEQHHFGQADISRLTGVQPPHISAFFAEHRKLPAHAAAKLGAYFKVDPALFLPKIAPATLDYSVHSSDAVVREPAVGGKPSVRVRARKKSAPKSKRKLKP